VIPLGIPSKYDPELHPKLAAGLARHGLIDKQIAEKMGIGTTTLNRWKKEHPEFAVALKVNKAVVNFHAEDCLYKRVTGYEYEEVTREELEVITEVKTENGVTSTVTVKPYKIKRVQKTLPPDVLACLAWLRNRDRENWKGDPDKFDSDRSSTPLSGIREVIEKDIEYYAVTRVPDPLHSEETTDTQDSSVSD
jgi:hypothetical protein